MNVRVVVVLLDWLVALFVSFMPIVTGERNIPVHDHHIDHAVLMLLGAIAGLALYRGTENRERPAWLAGAVLGMLIAMLLMAPSLYAIVDDMPWLHVVDHVVFVALAMLTVYAGQRYVRGVGWATGIMLETMAIVAAFGFGVAPAGVAIAATAPPVTASAADVAHGKELFAQNCAICHGHEGVGAEAPRLKGEASRKDIPELESWIKKPAPPMPALYPSPLNERDVDDIAAYVEQLK